MKQIIRKIKRKFLLKIFSFLPLTRMYILKNYILNAAGYDVNLTARISSSIKILGIENIKIGRDTFIGHETTFLGSNQSKVVIGNYYDISSKVLFVTGTHEIDVEGKRMAGKGYYKDIVVEDGVWIGARATILPGVRIGKKAIVAAGSVVNRDVPAYSLVAGNPAKVKKYYRNGELDNEL